jgi:hypothetical protein
LVSSDSSTEMSAGEDSRRARLPSGEVGPSSNLLLAPRPVPLRTPISPASGTEMSAFDDLRMTRVPSGETGASSMLNVEDFRRTWEDGGGGGSCGGVVADDGRRAREGVVMTPCCGCCPLCPCC